VYGLVNKWMTEKLKARLASLPKTLEEAEEQLRGNRLQRLGGAKCENYSAEEIAAILRLSRALGTGFELADEVIFWLGTLIFLNRRGRRESAEAGPWRI
jgi:hypothetical protein